MSQQCLFSLWACLSVLLLWLAVLECKTPASWTQQDQITADLYQANTSLAPELEFTFESKVEIQLESVCKSFAQKTFFVHYVFAKPHRIRAEQMVLGCEQDKQMQGAEWLLPWLQLHFWRQSVRFPVSGGCKSFRTLPCRCWRYIKALQCRSAVSLSDPDSLGMFTRTARSRS